MLHVTMALVRLMTRLLCSEADENEEYASALRELFENLGINLISIKKLKKGKRKFSKQLKSSRLARTEYLTIVENCDKFLEIYKQHSKQSDAFKTAVGLKITVSFNCGNGICL